jgi:outer membrane biosynthesis protein TonB
MRSLFAPLLLAALGLALGCSSSPRQPARPMPQSSLPDCDQTNGYPPCIYNGVTPYEGPQDYYPAYDYPYFPGTGVIVIPEPVPVPVPVPVPTPKPKPPKKPPPKHHRAPINPCHPRSGHPCP